MWFLWAYLQVKIIIPLIEGLQVFIVVVTTLIFQCHHYPHHANVISDGASFDFAVIGGGTAGCVVANRLTEIENWNVLLIEAGDEPSYVSEIPGVSVLLGSTFPDWNSYTVNDGVTAQTHKTQNIHLARGKVLGGSSSVNFMYYVRGNKADYHNWTSDNTNWDWDTVLKYFKKSEHFNNEYVSISESDSLHGKYGYLGVTTPTWEKETKKYFEAFQEIGHNILEEVNGLEQLGYSFPSFTIDDGRRQSTAYAFIRPIKERPNLFLLKNTLARKLIFKEGKAVGVEVQESQNKPQIINVKKEIILSAGAINSPQLLMLSGIGPKEHLQEIGVDTLLNSPNVGVNLQDHIMVPIILTMNTTANSPLDNLKCLGNTDRFPVPTIIGHVTLDKGQSVPDYQVTAFPLPRGTILPPLMCANLFKWNDEICIAMAESTHQEILFALITLLHPKSRGNIRLQSNNPEENPLIHSNYLSEGDDLSKFARCISDFTKVINTTYFKEGNSVIANLKVKQCADIPFTSQKYWECYALNLMTSQYHPTGTCAMGEKGVVDGKLRVKGVDGLRVVDASVIPKIVSGNTAAGVIMIGERASDIIKSDHGIRV